jgi:phosphoheptose isomerase
MKDVINAAFAESIRVKQAFWDNLIFLSGYRCRCRGVQSGNKLLLFGNGGSAATPSISRLNL